MKLSEYLTTSGQKATDFASKIECEPSTITRILRGERKPSVSLAVKIEEMTAGQVTPRDFIDAPIEAAT